MRRDAGTITSQFGPLVIGLIIGWLTMYMTVGLLMLLGLLIAAWISSNVNVMAFGLLFGAALGVLLCGLIGAGIGRYWPYPGKRAGFIAGVLLVFVGTALTYLFRGSKPPAYGPALGYVAGGLGLVVSFARSKTRTRPGAESTSSESDGEVELTQHTGPG